jgi:ribosomal protein S18 acetylase RimI-like enzyme
LLLRVTYLELCAAPGPPERHVGSESIRLERPEVSDYLALYRKVGESLGWDQRLLMPEAELAQLLQGTQLRIYLLRDELGQALGFCEFDRSGFPQIELKNFGLVPEARGRRLGSWLLSTALVAEWSANPARIWLHTDTWDHPAAIRVYRQAGFCIYDVRYEASEQIS